jgi:hypothetical protein
MSTQSAGANVRQLPTEKWDRVQGVLTNASAALLTCPAGGTYKVISILLTEKSNNARTATVRHVKSGGVDDNTSDVYQDLALAAKETVRIEGGGAEDPLLVLTGGDVLRAHASANTSVNYDIIYKKEL